MDVISSKPVYAFADFRLDPTRRLLLRGGETVVLHPKAFDLLLALIENRDRVLMKNELLDTVWAGQFVEEGNLAVQIFALRKIFGETKDEHRFIVTVPGQGYRFVAEVQTIQNSTLPFLNGGGESEILRAESDVTGSLQEIAEQQNPAAKQTAVLQSVSPTIRQNPRLLIWVCAGVVLLAGLATWWFGVGFGFWRYNPEQKNQVRVDAIPFAKAKIKQLTTKGKVRWAVLSPDGKFYAYNLVERGEYKESLWLGQTDGNNDIQLRPPDDVIYNGLEFSPAGETLYFALSGAAEQSQSGLFRIPVLGGVAEKLSDKISVYFALSPDGKQITFFRPNEEKNVSALVVSNLDGTNERELLLRPLDKPFAGNGSVWSPDGSMIAFCAVSDSIKESREIFIVRVADGSLEQLTALEWLQMSNLVWQRDGQSLIAVATNNSEILRHLWQIDYPSGNAHRLSRDTDTYGAALSISADGSLLVAVQLRRESNIWVAPADDLSQARQLTFSSINGVYGWNGLDWLPDDRIVFTAGIDRTLAIYVMNADGGNIRQITSAGFFDQRPNVIAGGRFIVFQSNRSGSSEIWRVGVDGSDLRQLTTGGGNGNPHPTPDGKYVVYSSTRGGKSFVWRVPVEGGEAVQVTDKNSTNPRVSPDGKFVACGYIADDDSSVKLAVVKIENGAMMKLFDVPYSAILNDGIGWMPDGKAVTYRDLGKDIWKQDLSGGELTRLKVLPEERIYSYGWSNNGKLFAFTVGRAISDAVLIKDFK